MTVTTRRASVVDSTPLLQWGVVGLTALLVLSPILPTVYQSVLNAPIYNPDRQLTLSNYPALVQAPAFTGMVANSLAFALIAALVAQLFGTAFAVLVGRTNMPGRTLIGALTMWPLFVSHLVFAIGWSIIYGPSGYLTVLTRLYLETVPWNLYSITGMAFVAGFCQVPIAYLYCLGAVKSQNPSLENTARVTGASPLHIFRTITLPLMRPAILTGLITNFILCLETLSIPLIFGMPAKIQLFTTYIYEAGIAATRPNYGLMSAAAVLLIAIVLATAWLQRQLLRKPERFVTVGGKGINPQRFDLGVWRWPIVAAAAIYLALFVLMPLAGLVLYSFTEYLTPLIPVYEVLTLQHFRNAFSSAVNVRALTNSIIISVVGAALGTVLVTLIAIVVHRSQFAWRKTLDSLAVLPRAVPGIITGIGIFYATVIFYPFALLRGTLALLIIALIMRYLPLGYGAVVPVAVQIDDQLERGARIAGATWWQSVRTIIIPILKPGMMSAFAVLFVHFLRDYSTGVFLVTPGTEMLGTSMLGLFIGGDTGVVAVLALTQIAITVVFLVLFRKLLEGRYV